MELRTRGYDLELAHHWMISSGLGPGGGGGTGIFKVLFVELRDETGLRGIGEAAPSNRYLETTESNLRFLRRVDPSQLSFENVEGSMRHLDAVGPGEFAAKGAVNMALLDGASRAAGKPLCDFLGLGFQEDKHLTCFSIGIDEPEQIRKKVQEAACYPALKLKVGSPRDRENLAALREVAPKKPVRVDANEAWKTKEKALQELEWLAADGHIELVEQPMPATTSAADLAWLKARSPLLLMADESFVSLEHAAACAEGFHAVNVKLVKTGGVTGAQAALVAARRAGLKTMLGCMIESSVLISAAAHLAALTDYLDLDGNLLITNDPYVGVSAQNGMLSFATSPEPHGLRVFSR